MTDASFQDGTATGKPGAPVTEAAAEFPPAGRGPRGAGKGLALSWLNFWLNFWLSLRAVLLTVLVAVMLADLLLLELKREVFRGGFLQAHRIAGWQIPLFLIEFAVVGALFYGFLLALWSALAARLRWSRPLAAWQFLWVAGVGSLLFIGIRYQLAQYFSDLLSFSVISDLGGGNLADAAGYVLAEGLHLLMLALPLGLLYLLGLWWLSPARKWATSSGWPTTPRRHLLQAGLALSGLAAIVALINRQDDVRYNLGYTTAYALARNMLDRATDLDGDGSGLFKTPADPAPFDSARYPGALDIPGDGIDQDGMFGDFRYVPRAPASWQFHGPRRNVVVVVLESARADALDAVVEGRPVMPNLQQMAREGAVAPHYYSHTGFTTSSIRAIFSGVLGSGQTAPTTSMFSELRQAGYQLGVFSGQPEAFGGTGPALQMKDGATVYFDAESAPEKRVFASRSLGSLTLSNEHVLAQLQSQRERFDWNKPVFLYLNLQSGHFPYHHPGMPALLPGTAIPRERITRANRDWLQRTYYNALASADRSVGALVSFLRQAGVYDNTVVLVSGDHGESLFDDGFLGHGHYINDDQTRTILVANRALPGMQQPLGQVDVMPMLMNAAGARQQGGEAQARAGVFQFVGTLDQPGAIAMVEAGGQRTSFNPESGEAQFGDGAGWIPRRQWEADSARSERLRALVLEWERLRWEDHLASRKTANTAQPVSGNGPATPR